MINNKKEIARFRIGVFADALLELLSDPELKDRLPPYSGIIIEGLKRIENGEEPSDVFGVKNEPHQQSAEERNIQIAQDYAELLEKYKREEIKSPSKQVVYKLSCIWGVNEGVIRKVLTDFRERGECRLQVWRDIKKIQPSVYERLMDERDELIAYWNGRNNHKKKK